MLTPQQTDHCLDMYNENCTLLQEAIASHNINKHTVRHIKNALANCLEWMKTQEYNDIKQALYDVLTVLRM